MNWTVFAVIAVILIILVISAIWLLSRYRRCPSDQILVVFGKAGKKETVVDGKKVETILPSKIIHGGGTFVWPVIQDYRMMQLTPHKIQPVVTGHMDIKKEDKKYNYLSAYEDYKQSWRKAVSKKTQEYYATMYPSPRQIEYIEKHY